MSTKYILVCDQCGEETGEGTGRLASGPHGDPDLQDGWYRLLVELWDNRTRMDFCCLKCVAAWASNPQHEIYPRVAEGEVIEHD